MVTQDSAQDINTEDPLHIELFMSALRRHSLRTFGILFLQKQINNDGVEGRLVNHPASAFRFYYQYSRFIIPARQFKAVGL